MRKIPVLQYLIILISQQFLTFDSNLNLASFYEEKELQDTSSTFYSIILIGRSSDYINKRINI